MKRELKVLAGIIGILAFAGVVLVAYKAAQNKSQPAPRPTSAPTVMVTPTPDQKRCVKITTGEAMSLSEAEEIALESECVQEGRLTGESFCNDFTGTWWLDLEIEKQGCAPACVINVATKKAEINWRCTGLIPGEEDEGRVFCQEPRPQICTMECIVNPPYICGSDKKSYCSTCQACANPKVEWYAMEDEPCGGD
jgi:hypothetical protein